MKSILISSALLSASIFSHAASAAASQHLPPESDSGDSMTVRKKMSRTTATQTSYAVGQEIQGTVVRCSLSGLDIRLPNGEIGFVVNQEISWPGYDVLCMPGAVVNVVVLAFKKEVALYLSMRRFQHDIFHANYVESLQVGMLLEGRIKSIKEYGVFVSIGPGVDALLHLSQINSIDEYTKDKIGSAIKVRVLSLDKKTHKVNVALPA